MNEQVMEKALKLPDMVIDFANKFINIFIVDGSSLQFQQWVKISILALIIILIFGLILAMYKIVELLIKSLSQSNERAFYLALAILMLFFTSEVSFKGACIALAFFMGIDFCYKYYKDKTAWEQKTNQDYERGER